MTTSRLPRLGQNVKHLSAQPEKQPEKQPARDDIGVKANTAEAMRLYQRGVAAARGGQRRIAAGLLTRSVQYDPNNEGAWLWLSGVLDDPHQIAFCLNSALKLNPASERARKGLRWLEERQLLKGSPKTAPLFDVKVGEAPVIPSEDRKQRESWWVSWRQSAQDSRRVNMLLWSVPLVVLFLALVINQAFELALHQSSTRPDISSVHQVPTVLAAPSDRVPTVIHDILPPTAVPILNGEPFAVRESATVAYLNALRPIRQDLHDAVEKYRNQTGRPGSASLTHAAAAQNLRSSVEQAYTTMQAMGPPAELKQAHAEYVEGLELELEAIDAIAEFYSSYQTELANRAAVRFQDANAHFGRARAHFDAYVQRLEISSAVSSHTVR